MNVCKRRPPLGCDQKQPRSIFPLKNRMHLAQTLPPVTHFYYTYNGQWQVFISANKIKFCRDSQSVPQSTVTAIYVWLSRLSLESSFRHEADGAPVTDPVTAFLNHVQAEAGNLWPALDYTNDNRFDDNDLVLFLYHYDLDSALSQTRKLALFFFFFFYIFKL